MSTDSPGGRCTTIVEPKHPDTAVFGFIYRLRLGIPGHIGLTKQQENIAS